MPPSPMVDRERRPSHHRRSRRLAASVTLALAAVLVPTPARAAPGDLDPTFNGGTATFSPRPEGPQGALAIALQPDGKALVSTVTRPDDGRRRVVLARFGTDGRLDPAFGQGGLVEDPGPDVPGFDAFLGAYDLALAPDGRIVAAGLVRDGSMPIGEYGWGVARFNGDGSRDTTFGGDGWVTARFGGECLSGAAAVTVDEQGRVVVAGVGGCRFLVARYLEGGVPDPRFGAGGVVDLGPGAALDVALDPAGRIVAGGAFGVDGEPGSDSAVVRLDPGDGSPDPSFGAGGTVTVDLGDGDAVHQVVLQPADGKVLAAAVDDTNAIHLARFHDDGSVDSSFSGGDGVTLDQVRSSALIGLGVQPDGRILASGSAGAVDEPDFAVARFLPDGSPDGTWGGGGVVTTDFDGGVDLGGRLAVRPDGDVLVAGFAHVGDRAMSAVAAYRGELAASLCPGVAVDDANVLVGTEGADVLVGTSGNDLLVGLGGADSLVGAGGDDCLWGGTGDDSLAGRAGDDALDGGPGADSVRGDLGDDVVTIAAGEVPAGATETIAGGPHAAGDLLRLGPGLGPDDIAGRRARLDITDPTTGGTFRATGIELTDTAPATLTPG